MTIVATMDVKSTSDLLGLLSRLKSVKDAFDMRRETPLEVV